MPINHRNRFNKIIYLSQVCHQILRFLNSYGFLPNDLHIQVTPKDLRLNDSIPVSLTPFSLMK